MTQKWVVKARRCLQGPIYVLKYVIMLIFQVWCHICCELPLESGAMACKTCHEGAVAHCMSKAVSCCFICCNLLKIKDKRTMPFVTFKHCQEDLNINLNLITNHNDLCNLNAISVHLYFEIIYSGCFVHLCLLLCSLWTNLLMQQ